MDAVKGKSPASPAGRTAGTRQRIVDAATDLFSAKGYEAVSMQDIADAVGIRKSSIYSHFKGKDEILQTILSTFNAEMAKSAARQQGDDAFIDSYLGTCGPAALMAYVGKQFEDLLREPRMRKIWRMISMEVYRNAMIRSFYQREVLDRPARFWEKAFHAMMSRGMIRQADAAALAREYHAFDVYLHVKYLIAFSDEEAETLLAQAGEEGTAHIRFFLEKTGAMDVAGAK